MAREMCHGCFGSGRGVNNSGSCVFCGGTGSIWVPDKLNPRPVGGYGRGGSSGGWGSNSFEDNVAYLVTMGVFFYLLYKGFTEAWGEWYWILGVAMISGAITTWLLTGPLRFLLSILKWVVFVALIGVAIYGLIQVFTLFNA